ncbi:AAA family ATPase [Spirulina sp. CCNP1310]|uniref:AAA family ATPase n=1 Tax=Spirulina sp. CCNP1310 TaxID=3110249 RepID=UPI002B21AF5A|nr:AAA family ATPase [Spirulina sp. CCNP1310]MEA5421336.1 AAA family ATPase [Spirulina sp. CCNP1310]
MSAINAIKKRVLQGEYFKDREKNIDYIQMNDGRRVQLIHCSSGQQEALPLTLILESLPFLQKGLMGRSIYIEEPEAHLFPSSQRDIVNLIATVYNADRSRLQFVITTHSPYILTAFNNLLQAGILAQGASPETLAKITQLVPESQFIDPQEIAVYQIANGTAESIILEDTGLIDAEIIDAVSEELAIQFDGLLEIG